MLKSLKRAFDSLNLGSGRKERGVLLAVIALALILPFMIPLFFNQPTAGRRKVLSVPKFCQAPYSHLCGATVASMTSAYLLGDEIDRDTEIAKGLFGKDDFDRPLFIEDIVEGIDRLAAHRAKIKREPLSFKAVEYQIDSGFPIIVVACHKGLNFSHAELIVGYDRAKGAVIYHDPWDGKEYSRNYLDYVSSDRKYWLYSAYFG
ncbi:MAG: papain-like cysteine protease family protein [Actinomycetota bacterium]|nr:papain-like cysteine protease family protein [Actinomycetota bacterium]